MRWGQGEEEGRWNERVIQRSKNEWMNAQQLSCQATTPNYKRGAQYIETTIPLVQAPHVPYAIT